MAPPLENFLLDITHLTFLILLEQFLQRVTILGARLVIPTKEHIYWGDFLNACQIDNFALSLD